ncbi:MAG: aminotransferase class III-fold pyridoxal phosphate-dependent enzyme [Oscillospiraceae bacterium]
MLRQHLQGSTHLGDIREIGLLNAIELISDSSSNEKATALAEKVMYGCLSDGLSFKVSQGNVLSLYPALTVTKDNLQEAVMIITNNVLNC